jgi:hypothetical protein
MFFIPHEDLGLMKKSARWVTKLLSQQEVDKRLEETSVAFSNGARQGQELFGQDNNYG